MTTTPTQGRVRLVDTIAERIRDGGFLRRIDVRAVSLGDGIYRVTVIPPPGHVWSNEQITVLVQVIESAFREGTIPPRFSAVDRVRIMFRWYR